jgi:regulator of PEP synthase PpsR (kinase-PPPase family)
MYDGKKIVIISDGSGKTAKRLLDAVLVQYQQKDDVDFALEAIYSQVRSKRELTRILKDIDDSYLVLYSIVSKELTKFLDRRLTRHEVLHLNVLEPMMETISKFLGFHPEYEPGLLQIIDDRYYKKVDSIGYTVGHDDGRGPTVEDADIVLIGPSRTWKTPISMYLACNFGLRVANIPMVRDQTMTRNLLKRIEDVRPSRIVGLLMKPEVLSRVREQRMNVLLTKDSHHYKMQGYHDIREVALEFRYCRDMYVTRGWQTVDVTRRAIEEIALEILKKKPYLMA